MLFRIIQNMIIDELGVFLPKMNFGSLQSSVIHDEGVFCWYEWLFSVCQLACFFSAFCLQLRAILGYFKWHCFGLNGFNWII